MWNSLLQLSPEQPQQMVLSISLKHKQLLTNTSGGRLMCSQRLLPIHMYICVLRCRVVEPAAVSIAHYLQLLHSKAYSLPPCAHPC